MKHQRVLFAALIGVLPIACGGDDGESKLCSDVKAKIKECSINADTSAGCNKNANDAVRCAAQCFVDAPCEEITGAPASNSYYQCNAVCSGGNADDFICADGSGSLAQAGVCDGTPQCPDGSDEAGCSS